MPPHQIMVWQVDRGRWEGRMARCWAWLTPAERQQAEALAAPIRQQFILSRGLLRGLLGHYLGCEPTSLQFDYGPHGKPSLAHSPWQFNLSHGGDLLLYAIAPYPIGIDVEPMRPRAMAKLAQRWFQPQEAAAILALPPAQQQAAFFATWTRKEAYLKATGEGLAGLSQVEVSTALEPTAGLRAIAGSPQAAAGWTLRSWQPQPDYWAAVAIAPPGASLAWHWADLTPEGTFF